MTNKNKTVRNDIGWYLVVALLAVAGMAYCFYVSGIFPFGENSNLFSDLATQYVNFLVFFRNSSLGEKIFSLTKGFGGQTFGLLSYYTFSPFNFITYLFAPENIEMALFAIFIARAVFMAGSMFTYLREHFDNSLMNVGFALMYTFYPFFTRYYFNILWADCFALLPLLILGTERIMDGKSGRLFVFAYVYSLVSNYYIAYMSSLFVLCWFVYRFILLHGFRVKQAVGSALKMAYYAIISIMLSAPVLLPSFFLLMQGKFGDDTISSWTVVKPYDIFTLPISLFEGAMVYEYTPHLIGSAVCIFLLVAYLFNKKTDRKEKLLTILFLLFMFCGFAFRILGYVWHGLSAPQGFHNRQTYLYAFLMLTVCCASAQKLDWSTGLKTLLVVLPVYAGAFVYTKAAFPQVLNTKVLTATLITVAIMAVVLIMTKFSHRTAITALAIYICISSVYLGGYFMKYQYSGDKPYTMAPSRGQFKTDYLSMQSILAEIKDDGFYRIEDPTAWSQNQAMTHGYNSVSHYSSVFESAQKEMFIYYGYEDTYYSTTYSRSLPLNDFVFGVKYVISSDASLVTNHYDVVYKGDKTVYCNPFWIPVAYTGATNQVPVAEYWVDTVNNMAIALTGIDIYRPDGNADYDKVRTIAAAIRENAITVEENTGATLVMRTHNTDDRYLLSSLMYDESWNIKVNGKTVSPQKYMEYFLSVPLETGVENLVEMTYIPQGLPQGVAVMAVAFVVILLHFVLKRKFSVSEEK